MSVNTREERAAILLTGLDATAAENVLRRLAPEQGSRLRTQMSRLTGSEGQRTLLGEVVREFGIWLRDGPGSAGAGPYGAANRAARDRSEDDGDGVAQLRRLPADRLAAALRGENPRTVSLVLDALDAEGAAEVLRRLPADVRRAASVWLGRGGESNPILMQRIAHALVQKSRGGAESSGPDAMRAGRIAEMLRGLDRVERLDLLAALETRDPETAARVRADLYRFEDVARVADRSVQKILSGIGLRTLALALTDAPEAAAAKIVGNMSPRVQEMAAAERELLGSTPPGQVALARRKFTEAMQSLDAAGALLMDE
jgi:flagellar motor switch protein FliG